MSTNKNIAIYSDGEIELKISVDDETIWLTQKQIAELFDKDIRTVNDHIKAIYKEEELYENSTIRNFRIVQREGNREVTRDVLHYNLDVIISIGYRANSKKATRFRQWATTVLKEYITNGYAINTHKITEQRLLNLENDMQEVKSHMKNSTLEMKQGIFYNGEIFDAYLFVANLIKKAKESIILIDNYVDETTLTLFSNNQNIKIEIYTQNISKQLLLTVEKYNKQYSNIELKNLIKFHDRFLLIDNNELYHIGASLKDLGNKTFAFSKLNIDLVEFLGKLK
ncbi:MAG: DNA-binding protein [Sulfurimonas sp. RIFCSPHIGHO2_12_FULL_36_9]|uniref:RhuM family protein n=1 Tax=Sulfurimonas sp. RIFCSPLOWO2_12_36_12 TaxID=1802253 RepID=UPI0008AEA1E9|nr:RhuM family protein [Sulfurimonas sp. RIFCSPLOWO2_12_36_12]OHD97511.1 MAG: DNA-binding protein [Sulfurimonas sp. RIFCSPLOWO2_02_FULL_36_28]OHD99527.1 MAG: DNA-binding protein [Sulfurimonas sp. RIFCSPHIGHO2_12_FULL_36_9]OHE00529.1 MAG: DNA-binding protein [Sulfurimonas sp. RIFCSPLOWO2_12_36_12]OHE03124.1 MAG: DNA-binding protein [Sulfurimonas sp. RIFCSPLOWO2_12_FULL_36_74]